MLLVSCFVVRQMIKYSFREVLMVFTGDNLLHGLIVSFRLNVIVSVNEPEMVDVAALHMWNQKYGPQVSFDCNTQHVQSAGDFCSKHKPIFSPFLPVPPPFLTLTASTGEDSRSFLSASFSSASSSSVLYSSMVSPLEKWMILRGTFSLCCCCCSSLLSSSPSSTLSKSFPRFGLWMWEDMETVRAGGHGGHGGHVLGFDILIFIFGNTKINNYIW